MPQTRICNYGQTATSRWENLSLYATQRKGVYRGMGLGLDLSGNLIINPGYAVLPSIVNAVEQLIVVWESTEIGLGFTPPAVKTVYTAVSTHENREIQGGVEVTYELRRGEYADISDGIVIGWVYHPGLGVPLTTDMLVNAPKSMAADHTETLVNTLPVDVVAPFGTRSYIETVGPDVTLTDPEWDAGLFIIHQLVQNSPTAPGQQLARQILQYYVRNDLRPTSFDMRIKTVLDAQTYLTVEVFDTNQAPVLATGSPFYGSGTWEWVTLEVDRNDGIFTDGEPYTLRLTHNVAVGGEIRLAAVRANFWPFPT